MPSAHALPHPDTNLNLYCHPGGPRFDISVPGQATAMTPLALCQSWASFACFYDLLYTCEYAVNLQTKSRKPAARLGEVFFANKVSLGGLGAERS